MNAILPNKELRRGAFPTLKLVGMPSTPAPSPDQAAFELEAQRARAAELYRLYSSSLSKERRAALIRHHANKRRSALLMRTPAWADLDAIHCVYKAAARIEWETGIPQQVDHIIPLQGHLVSGLHVANNLQVLPATENIRKSNHFEVEE